MALNANRELMLRNVRFSFLYAFEPQINAQSGKKSYGTHLILAPDHPQIKDINAAILDIAKEKWPQGWEAIIKQLKTQDRICFRQGDTKLDKQGNVVDGYAGQRYITTSRKNPFPVLETRGGVNVQLTAADGRPRSGDYGNAHIQLWVLDVPGDQGGRRICCTPLGIQYVRKGTPLGGGARVSSVEEFGVEPSDADADAPVPASASNGVADDLLG